MRISISSTNPCHLWEMARGLHAAGALGTYYSGYPVNRLPGAEGVPVAAHSWRTLITYGCLRYVPEKIRPSNDVLFRWQDQHFDRWVARHLEPVDFIHAMAGQCRRIFIRARETGMATVMNHATGPERAIRRALEPEYSRLGWPMPGVATNAADPGGEEAALADLHCAASSVVRDQLAEEGVPPDRIWVVPYGADQKQFPRSDAPPADFTLVFAGQPGVRKGFRIFLEALRFLEDFPPLAHVYGTVNHETFMLRERFSAGNARLHLHGAVDKNRLAAAFRENAVLVLPSFEEGFGLVVPQALSSGMPCIVSDRVGAGDLIRHRENGSVFPCGNGEALVEEIKWWRDHYRRVEGDYSWNEPARLLMELSARESGP